MEKEESRQGTGAESALERAPEGTTLCIPKDIVEILRATTSNGFMHEFIADRIEVGYEYNQRELRRAILRALCAC